MRVSLYWNSGTKEIIEAESVTDAISKKGYTLNDLEFLNAVTIEGEEEYKWDDETMSWIEV